MAQKQVFEIGFLDCEWDCIFLDININSSSLARIPFFKIAVFDNTLDSICKCVQLYESSLISKRLRKLALTYLDCLSDCIDKPAERLNIMKIFLRLMTQILQRVGTVSELAVCYADWIWNHSHYIVNSSREIIFKNTIIDCCCPLYIVDKKGIWRRLNRINSCLQMSLRKLRIFYYYFSLVFV